MGKCILSILVCVSLGFTEGRWVEQKNPYSDSEHISYCDICFIDSLTGYVLGGGWSGSFVLKTVDSGKNWEIQKVPNCGLYPQTNTLNASGGGIFFVDSSTGWIAEDYASTYSTVDGGRTWAFHQTPIITASLNDVFFVNARKGWIVGNDLVPHGLIFYTEDGGDTWVVQDSLRNGGYNAVTFLDTLKGFAVGDSGFILRTLDGGRHWASLPSGTTNNLHDIQFADSLHGIIVCLGNALKTTDGGKTWSETQGGAGNDLAFVDTLHAWAVVANFGISYSGDGGISWQLQECNTYVPFLWGVSFPDTAHGWAVGDQGKIVHYELSTGIDEIKKVRAMEGRLEIRPNPFGWQADIEFQIPQSGFVTIKIYDAMGALRKELLGEEKTVGRYIARWDGNNDSGQRVPAGIYFCRLEINDWPVGQKKIVLIY